MNTFNAIPSGDLLGYLVLTEEGSIVSSSGELENDEKSGALFYKLVNTTNW
jgi:hypothetical protein